MSLRRPRRRNYAYPRTRGSAGRTVKALLVGLFGAWVAIILWGGVSGDMGIITVHGALRPSVSGITKLRFPPLGSISAQTHSSPVALDLSVEQVHIAETAQWLKQHKSPRETADLVESGLTRMARRLLVLTLLVGAGGAFLACALFKVGWSRALGGVIVGLLAVAVPLGIAALTYNIDAFQNPVFDGEMARAPQMLEIAQEAWEKNSKVVREMPRIASRVANLCGQLESAGYRRIAGSGDYYSVLLISDLHNNPVAVRYALDIAQTYGVKSVLIAGDFTDLGHPLEAGMLAGLKKFHRPMLGVTGNHDSRATVRALASVPDLRLLDDGQTAMLGSVRVVGFADPASRRANTGSVNVSRRKLNALSRRIASRLARNPSPDLLLVHNNEVGRDAAGRVPVIAEGHLHQAFVVTRKASVIVNPGTTGAAGVRYFSATNKPVYSAAVLHFSPGRSPRLRKVDSIKMQVPSGDFSVTRESVSAGR